jgi:exonuclease III
MQKNEVSVLGVSEVRWRGQGEIKSGDFTVYYSGGERAEKIVAIVVHGSIVRSVVKKIIYNDRTIAIKLQAEPINILIVQVYMPTSEHEDDEVEELYGIIEEILEEDGKGVTNTIIMGDWNSFVGDKSFRDIAGPHGLGRNNHRVQMLIKLSERNVLNVTNTWFKKPKRRLYEHRWKTPGDRSRHHLDYIIVKHRFRNSVKDVQTLPGAQLTIFQVLHQAKEIYKVSKEKTTVGFGEIIYSKTKSAGYSR